MFYDQSWMGYGLVGGLEAGAISLAVAALLYLLLHRLGRGRGWGHGREMSWAFLLAMLLTALQDIWNLFYLNFANLQSVSLMRATLSTVHDPDSIGTRVLLEVVGAMLGVYIAWACSGGHRELE